MSDKNQIADFIAQEESILSETYVSLQEQTKANHRKRYNQTELARDLTSEIVNTLNAEEKVQIYSDEAVAHRLAEKAHGDIASLEELKKEPYFARIELIEEIDDSGKTKKIEYKIGKTSNPDCRIIDWRKAPIAKLYYEYQEGDEYDEDILGRERFGTVRLRNSYQIEQEVIKEINCKFGKISRDDNGKWNTKEQATGNAPRSDYSQLPEILSLISGEQFQSITRSDDIPVIIQGIAGSGKTIVALHRISWLLHENNSDLNAKQICFTMKSAGLHSYVQKSQTTAGIDPDLKIKLWSDFLLAEARKLRPELGLAEESCPASIRRMLYSEAFYLSLQERLAALSEQADFTEITQAVGELLDHPELILEHDKTKLLTKELIRNGAKQIDDLAAVNCFYPELLVCLLLLAQQSGLVNTKFKHLVIDEIQDFSRAELELAFGFLKNKRHVTLLGDTNQSISTEFSFPGWHYVKQLAGISAESEIVELNVSHRSTFQIISVAEEISGGSKSVKGRHGKQPIHFKCASEDAGLKAAMHWLKTAQEKYPTVVSAILAKDKRTVRNLHSKLRPFFGESVQIFDSSSGQIGSIASGIMISDIASIKGLEFYNVIVWGCNDGVFAESQFDRKLLYVAATRAEENLCFVSWQKSSSIIEGIDPERLRIYSYAG